MESFMNKGWVSTYTGLYHWCIVLDLQRHLPNPVRAIQARQIANWPKDTRVVLLIYPNTVPRMITQSQSFVLFQIDGE